jgi:2-polyprenyl-3-methyl-5-hydroxy-6-metoxy-1,4-benzoquinol methylase
MKCWFELRLSGLIALVVTIVGVGCSDKDADQSTSSAGERAAATAAARVVEHRPAESAGASNEPRKAVESGHDPLAPPIDCPLRKQGIDPAHMRPFEDLERYIAFLERADRAVWQKPDDVIAALGLRGTETVMDLGAGSGYFAFRLAKALPQGKVIAAEIEPEMIRHIHHKALTESVRNIEPRLIQARDPEMPEGVDLVFVCDVLHHVADRPSWLAKITKTMRYGAELVLIEFKEGELPEGPPESVKISRDELVQLVTDAGLVLASERADLLPYQTFLIFRKP